MVSGYREQRFEDNTPEVHITGQGKENNQIRSRKNVLNYMIVGYHWKNWPSRNTKEIQVLMENPG